MAVNLVKRGTKVNLMKEQPGLKRVRVEIYWDANRYDTGGNYDLDIVAVATQENGKCREDRDFVVSFGYDDKGNSLAVHPSGAIVHSGDERTGGKEGPDETITVDFTKMPPHIVNIDFIATTNNGITFGQVPNAKVRIINDETGQPIIPDYDLEDDFSNETAVKLIRLYLKDGDWRFSAEGKGYVKGLEAFIVEYGLEVGRG
jgi:tellurium resistance protein TerD